MPMRNELERGMSSSENPPATKCHKNCHKREALRRPRKAKGPCGKRLCHTDRLDSGEGGIRTLDALAGISVFETDAFDHSATSPNAYFPSVFSLFPPAQVLACTTAAFVGCDPSIDVNQPLVREETYVTV